MKIYYGLENTAKHHNYDPDYFVYLPKEYQGAVRQVVGKIFKVSNKKGIQYWKIVIYGDEEDIHLGRNMKLQEPNPAQSKIKSEVINLDELLDPFKRLKRNYYIVEIAEATCCRQGKKTEALALVLVIQEECGNLDDKEKYRFKGKQLFLNIEIHHQKVWLLKNLCDALSICGKYRFEDLAKLLVGRRVKARIMTNDDLEVDRDFRVIKKFDKADE